MITIRVDEDDVQYNAEGNGLLVMAEAGVVITNSIRMIREIKDDDKFIRKIVDFAIEQEKELER